MQSLLLILSLMAFGLLGTAYAQPLDDITATVLEFKNSTATVQLVWNHDDTVSNYEIGCVSCSPNFSNNTTSDEIVLQNITSLESGFAVLYVIAFNADDSEIITVKQVMLELR